MGIQRRPAAGNPLRGKCIPHHSRSVATTKFETSKTGKDRRNPSVKHVEEPQRHHTPTASGPIGQVRQGTGKGRQHKSSGGKDKRHPRQSAPRKVDSRWNRLGPQNHVSDTSGNLLCSQQVENAAIGYIR